MAKRGPKTLESRGLKKKIGITVSIPPEVYNELVDIANGKGKTMSAIVSALLEKVLENNNEDIL
jgi:predicted DNA-binding protein